MEPMLARKLTVVALLLAGAGTAAGSACAADHYVDAVAGVDSPSGGGASAPWKTITYASTHYAAGDLVHLAAGTYDEAGNGETFPVSFYNPVSLIGAGRSLSTIASTRVGLIGLVSIEVGVPGLISTVQGIGFDGGGVVGTGLEVGFPADGAGTASVLGCGFSGFRGTTRNGNPASGLEFGVQTILPTSNPALVVDMVVDGNRFENCETGVQLHDLLLGMQGPGVVTERSRIQNNAFLDNGHGVDLHLFTFESNTLLRGESQVRFNTFARNQQGIGYSDDLEGSGGPLFEVDSNIFALGSDVGFDLAIRGMAANLFFDNAVGLARIDTALKSTIQQVNADPTHDPAFPSLEGDPLFVNLPAGDVHLGAGSPAIDRAKEPSDPLLDMDSDARPVDGDHDSVARSDIGADEVAGPVQLMRAIRIGTPSLPALSDIYPMSPTNSLTPVVDPAFVAPYTDAGILDDSSRPMALYQTTGRGVIYAVKDRSQDGVIITP